MTLHGMSDSQRYNMFYLIKCELCINIVGKYIVIIDRKKNTFNLRKPTKPSNSLGFKSILVNQTLPS